MSLIARPGHASEPVPLAGRAKLRLSFLVPRHHLLPLLSLLVALVAPAEAAPPRATLLGGDACVQTSKGCAPIPQGGVLPSNEELKAGEGGARLRLTDGTTLELSPEASLKIQMTMPVPLGPGGPVKAQTMTLSSGRLRIDASPSGKTRRAVLLRGPRKAQLILSGESAVSLKDETLSAVNLSGKMLATTANDWSEIPPGKALSLTRTDPKPQLRDPLPTPRFTGGRWATTNLSDTPLLLTWSEAPGARSYELRLLSDKGALLKRLPLGAERNEIKLPDLPPGSYEARLAALDEGGLESLTPQPARLALLAVGLPPGGFRSGPASVQVSEGQSLSLAHAAGVELAYDKGASYAPAGQEFVMRGDLPRLLRFRVPGATLDGTLQIEPRSLAAVVELAPKNARWPRDTVTGTIRLVNKSGSSLPSDVRMVPRVTLGVTPIEARFQEEGPGLLRVTIAPQAGSLPAALRIEVHDQHGIYLGRGFLEIAP